MNKLISQLAQNPDFSAYSPTYLGNLIQSRMAELKMQDFADYFVYFDKNSTENDLLESGLKNSYSLFFRNRLTYEVIRHLVLPRLAVQKAVADEVRVWSVGCASGHEPYSLAIVLETFNKISSRVLKYRIFATDREFAEIENAVLGEYSRQDLGNLTLAETDKWFKTKGKRYKIDARLKKNIQYEIFDLLDKNYICPPSSIFGDFDIIMCANVLMYYNVDVQMRIVDNFKKSIVSNGLLITGEAEREILLKAGCTELIPQSCIFKV